MSDLVEYRVNHKIERLILVKHIVDWNGIVLSDEFLQINTVTC